MMVCEARCQVFLHNPKAAGIAVGNWLRKHHGYVDAAPDLGAPRHPDRPDSYMWRHAPTPPDGCEHYEKWCIVRHPLRRWESYFNYTRRWEPEIAGLSFDEFTAARVTWLPKQVVYVQASDYWIQVENLQAGLAELGLTDRLEELTRENVTGQGVLWTDRSRARVLDHFHEDFHRCGYRLPR